MKINHRLRRAFKLDKCSILPKDRVEPPTLKHVSSLPDITPPTPQEQLKDRFIAELGADDFHEGWQSMLRMDPTFFSAGLTMSAVPRKKRHLSVKNQHLISLAVDASATHLYAPGIRAHVTGALEAGATRDEVLEVIETVSCLGIHACTVGVPLLVEVLKEQGLAQEEVTKPFDENKKRLAQEFMQVRGYWHPFWRDFLQLDPEFFEAYLQLSSIPWTKDPMGKGKGRGRGVLEPKIKELIYCACDCAATHLYTAGLKLHYQNALSYGATPQEILEVLELATLLGLHSAHVAVPIIEDLTGDSARLLTQ